MYSGHRIWALISGARDRSFEIFITALGALLIGSAPTASCAAPAAGQAMSLTAEDPRPVSQAVQLIVQKYGYQVTYEDPAYVYDGDLKDRVVKGYKDRIPAGGTLSVNYNSSSGLSTVADVAGLLRQLLQAHAASDLGGHFRLLQDDQVLHVIPAEVKGSTGNWASQASILDTIISLPDKERSGMTMLEDICSAVGLAARTNIVVYTIPNNVILPYRGRLSAKNESARSVLLRALNGTGRRLTWILHYDPTDHRYGLNILWVPDRVSLMDVSPKTLSPPASSPALVPQTITPGVGLGSNRPQPTL